MNLCPRGVNQQIFNYPQIMQILGTKVDLNPPQKLISPLLVQEFINKVAGHPLVQGERCLHMFLTEVNNYQKSGNNVKRQPFQPELDLSNYVPGKVSVSM